MLRDTFILSVLGIVSRYLYESLSIKNEAFIYEKQSGQPAGNIYGPTHLLMVCVCKFHFQIQSKFEFNFTQKLLRIIWSGCSTIAPPLHKRLCNHSSHTR